MKKANILFLTAFLLLFAAPFSVFAGSGTPLSVEAESNAVPFTFITGENDDFQPKNEYSITFSKKITLNGESVRGARIRLSVSYPDYPDKPPVEYDEVIVGPSLKYMQPVALELGDNYITITVEKDGYDTSEIEAVIRRKDGNILESLQNLIIIPGVIK